jgi:hypothetical protein
MTDEGRATRRRAEQARNPVAREDAPGPGTDAKVRSSLAKRRSPEQPRTGGGQYRTRRGGLKRERA